MDRAGEPEERDRRGRARRTAADVRDRAEPGRGPGDRRGRSELATVGGATGYNVYRRAASGAYDYAAPLNGATPIAATTFSDPGAGLVAGATYAYVVRAVTAGAESANSNERSATPVSRLAPPAGATATPISTGRVRVELAQRLRGRRLQRLPAPHDRRLRLLGAPQRRHPGQRESLVETTALNGDSYRYVIRSVVDGAGGTPLESLTSSPESNPATSDAVPPASVTIANPGSPLSGAITLTGTATDAGSGVASVQMQYAPAGTLDMDDGVLGLHNPVLLQLRHRRGGRRPLRPARVRRRRRGQHDGFGNRREPADRQHGPDGRHERPRRERARHDHAERRGERRGLGRGIRDDPARTHGHNGLDDRLHGFATSSYSCPLDTTALAGGGYDFRAIATDAAGNTTTSATLANRVVDNSGPTAVSIQAVNGGGTAAKPEPGDSLIYTFSEAMRPASILAGWTGAPTAVTVRFNNGNPDVVTVWDAANTTQTALGSVRSGKKYVTGTVVFTDSTAVMSANTVVVTLGTPSGPTSIAKGNTTMQWTTSSAATDLAGNPLAPATVGESGGRNSDF